MRNILIMAGKEMQEGMRNRWVLAATLLMAALALALTLLGSAPTGQVGADPVSIVVVSLTSLTIFLVPLIALLISHDAIVGEIERGTMALLLSYPIGRWQVVLGKFLGHVAILAVATLIGYGAAALALVAAGSNVAWASWTAFAAMVGSSVALGAVYVALGYGVSALAGNRGIAAGAAIGVWLATVILYDLALLGALVADEGRFISRPILNALLLLNPNDVYRLLNLAGFENIGVFTGMSGLAAGAGLERATLAGALGLWMAAPLAVAALAFRRREI